MSVEYTLVGDVAVVTLARADRFNAIETTLSSGVVDAVARAADEARALVLTGSGKAFCAGADLTELIADYEARGPKLGDILDRIFHPVVAALVDAPVPTVAAINGVAAGAGLGLSLACDIRIAAEAATFVSAFTGIGLVPDSGSTWGLAATIGVGRALEMTMTNRRLDAREAVAWGLCAEVVPDDVLRDRAMAVAGALADLAPDALVTTRRLIREAVVTPFSRALAAEREQQDRLGRAPAHMEGVRAFVEKRKPNYRAV